MQVMQIFPSSVKLFCVQLAALNGLNISFKQKRRPPYLQTTGLYGILKYFLDAVQCVTSRFFSFIRLFYRLLRNCSQVALTSLYYNQYCYLIPLLLRLESRNFIFFVKRAVKISKLQERKSSCYDALCCCKKE